ncbi:MAG: SusC/RagA family TonB-linked outer membrane protein [Bacteroidaceae bacterium]|nr:SusC/RagA family TonB-linked outer membrane protein [Bacteroidaceae bacterium]
MQHFNKYGIAAFMFFLGTALPAVAQEEVTEEVTEVAAPIKKVKPAKTYPTIDVTGKVMDAVTGEPLAGVQLQAFNNKYYTAMTDENGEYTIKVPQFITAISARLEGYNLNNISLNGRTSNVDIRMQSNLLKGDYTTQVSARKSVSEGDFVNTPALTIDQEIQNRLGADVRTIQRSANPAEGVAMFVNGLNSLNSTAMPLVVVDGVVYDMLYDATMLHTGYFNNLLQAINVDDVESVEVLKNGTAIYGAKAANGVILIKTKRCHSMATRIDVNLNMGLECKPKTFELMDAGQYRSFASNLLQTTNTTLTEFKFLHSEPDYYYYNVYHNNTDWNKEISRTALTQNYGLSIQGGDDIAQYNLSVGYGDSKSTLKRNDMQRFNVRFNTDIVLNKWFYTQFDASYTNVTRDLRSDGWENNQFLQALASPSALANIKAPFLSPYDFATDRHVTNFIADADDYLNEVWGSINTTRAQVANPVAILENGEAKNKNHSDCTMINVSVAPTWEPTNDFSLTEKFSYTIQTMDEAYFTPIIGMPTYSLPGNLDPTENSKYSMFSRHNAVSSDTRADWKILPNGAHRLEMFGGIRFLNDTYRASYLYADGTGSDKTPNTGSKNRKIDGTDTNWRSLSYYANVDYNYMEKYYLSGQLSMETSSRFGKNAGLKMFGVGWAFFPSIQAAWVISNEDWFRAGRAVNMLKLNGGFESVGNDAMDNSATLTYMTSEMMFGNANSSLGLSNIGSSSLQWETTNRFNVGVEGNFFDNRLNLRANYFFSKTNNLITLSTLAYVAGIPTYYTNDGALKNNGFDAAFNAKIIDGKQFKLELGASIGHYKNELTRLPQGVGSFETKLYDGTILSEVGRSAGVFYGYKTAGVYKDTEAAETDGKFIRDAANNPVYFGAGDIKFVDKDGNGEINEKDRFVIGDPNPDIYGNISLKLHYGQNWTLSTNFNYSLGNDIYNYQRAVLEGSSNFVNQTTAVNRRWTTEGQVTDMPKATYSDPMGNSRFSDRWIEDGSYLKLKNVTLSYKVPIQNEYIQGLTVWAAANNLFTLTKYLGPDPEITCGNSVLYQGIDAGYLSSGRSFHIGVKINL